MFHAPPSQANTVTVEVNRLLDYVRSSIMTNLATVSQDNPTRLLQTNILSSIEVLQRDLSSIDPQFLSSDDLPSLLFDESLFVSESEEIPPAQVDPGLSSLDLEHDIGEPSINFRRPVASLRPVSSASFPLVSDIDEEMELDNPMNDEDSEHASSDDEDDVESALLDGDGTTGGSGDENNGQNGDEEEDDEGEEDEDEQDEEEEDDDNTGDDQLENDGLISQHPTNFVLALADSIVSQERVEALERIWIETTPNARHRDHRDVAQALSAIDESEGAVVGQDLNRRWALRDLVARREEIMESMASKKLKSKPNRYNRPDSLVLDELMRLGYPHMARGPTLKDSSQEYRNKHQQLKSRLRAGGTWYALDSAFGFGTFALVPVGFGANFSTTRLVWNPL